MELKELRKEIVKGAQIRARTKWIEQGEKPTRYFANLEKRNYVNKMLLN